MSLPKPTLINGDSVFAISSANFSLTLPNTVDSDEEVKSFTNYITDLDAFDGGIKTRNSSRNPLEVSLSGVLMDSYEAATLKRILGEKEVTITRDNKSLTGEVAEYSVREAVEGELWNFSFGVISPLGFWLELAKTTTADQTVVMNDGDVLTYPTFAVTGGVGGATGMTIAVNGSSIIYDGIIQAGEVLTIDTGLCTASLDGVNVLSSMNDAFFVSPPPLIPGANTIVYSPTGSATTVITYRERFV